MIDTSNDDSSKTYLYMFRGTINVLSCVKASNTCSSEGVLFGRIMNCLDKYDIKYSTNDLDFEKYDFNIFMSCYYTGSDIKCKLLDIIENSIVVKTKCIFYSYVCDFVPHIDHNKFNHSFPNKIVIGEIGQQSQQYSKFGILESEIKTLPLGIDVDLYKPVSYSKNNTVMIYIKEHSGFTFKIEQMQFLIDLIPKIYTVKIYRYSLDNRSIKYDHREYMNDIINTRFVLYYSPFETLGNSNIEFRVHDVPFFCLKLPSVKYYDENSGSGHDLNHEKVMHEEIMTKSGFICDNRWTPEEKIRQSFIKFMEHVDNGYFTPRKYIVQYLNISNQVAKYLGKDD